MKRMLVIVPLTALAVAGCGAGAASNQGGSSAPEHAAVTTPASTADYDLITASDPRCQASGEEAAHYLDTGKPHADDVGAAGMWRQQVLGMSGQARSLFIRRKANAVIVDCDEFASKVADATSPSDLEALQPHSTTEQQILSSAISQATAAKAAAERSQAAAARAQKQAQAQHHKQVIAKEQATCATVGGTWDPPDDPGACVVTYNKPTKGERVQVLFDDNGNVVAQYGQTAEQCRHDGYTWHADTKICAV
jgi:hypothetical protein